MTACRQKLLVAAWLKMNQRSNVGLVTVRGKKMNPDGRGFTLTVKPAGKLMAVSTISSLFPAQS